MFVLGWVAERYPALVRRIVDEGHEIGVHTLTHVDLGTAPDWQRQLEIQAAQNAIIEATGGALAPWATRTRP